MAVPGASVEMGTPREREMCFSKSLLRGVDCCVVGRVVRGLGGSATPSEKCVNTDNVMSLSHRFVASATHSNQRTSH